MKKLHLNLRKGSIVTLALILISTSVSVVAEPSSIFYVDLAQSLPGDWTIINGGNTADTWTYLEGGFGVVCNDRGAGSTAVMDEQLISPIVDCSRLIRATYMFQMMEVQVGIMWLPICLVLQDKVLIPLT
jgi:hypothetical protein